MTENVFLSISEPVILLSIFYWDSIQFLAVDEREKIYCIFTSTQKCLYYLQKCIEFSSKYSKCK